MEKGYELELERPEETERRYGKGKSGCWEDVESELLTPTFPIGKRSVALRARDDRDHRAARRWRKRR